MEIQGLKVPAIRPKLLVLASTYPRWQGDHEPGFVHELSRRLTANFEVIVLTSHAPGARREEIMDGVRVLRYRYAPTWLETLVYGGGIAANLRRSRWKFALIPGFFLAQYACARNLMRQEHIAALHAHWLIPQGMVASWLSRRFGVPFVVTSHGGDLYGLRNGLLTRWKRSVAGVCAAMSVVSNAMRTEVEAQGLRPPRLAVLPMGVDLKSRFVPDAAIERRPDELLFVGRLVPKKGLRHLLNAMPAILTRRPEAVLTVAGFGPEELQLRAHAAALGITPHVKFLGATPQERLPELYRRASVLVAPFVRDGSGDQEGLPVVLMEAIGCGCPIIAGNIAGVEDLLGPFHQELSIDPANTAQLAAAVLNVLEQPARAPAHVLELRAYIAQFVDWENIAAQYISLVSECIDASTGSNARQCTELR